jgi:hypothetical protein
LRHSDLVTDRRVTRSAGADLTGDHLARVQPDAQLQGDAVAIADRRRQRVHLVLNGQGRQTGPKSMVLQHGWGSEHRHDAVTGELVDRAAIVLHYGGRPIQQLGHDLAKALRPHSRRDLHRMHDVGEQHRHLLVLGRLGGARDRRSTLVAELSVLAKFHAASGTRGHGIASAHAM